jgi:steroid delta-isomerase-like uncharacterized protein
MTTDANIAIVRRLFDEGWNKGDLAVVDELVAADAVSHHDGPVTGREPWKESITLYRSFFPDLLYTIDDVIAADDKVVARWTAVGSDTVGFLGMPPTGRQAAVTGITIYRLAGGRLVEHWDEFDLAGLLQKIGIIPAEAPLPH